MKNEKLVIDNVKLVHAVINRLFPTYRGDDDIVSEGLLGLVKAANTFNEKSETSFSTYAFCSIRNEIISYLRRERRFADTVSLDDPIGEDGEGGVVTLGDTIASDETADCTEESSLWDRLLSKISDRDRTIVVLKMRGYSAEEIALATETTPHNVWRVLRRLRSKMTSVVEEDCV